MADVLTRIELKNFRCFPSRLVELGNELNFLLGPNAQGKTSVLEAISVLLRLKSPCTNTLLEAITFGKEAFLLEGNYGGKHLSLRFSPKHQPQRLLKIDDVPQQERVDYLKRSSVVWFSREDLSIIHGPGEKRRRFLDSAGLQLYDDYREHFLCYYRALRSRNMLLKERRPLSQIESYHPPLAKHGEALLRLRATLLDALLPYLLDTCEAISGEKLLLTYQPGVRKPLQEALENSLAEERKLGMTIVGPHRDDLLLTLNDLPVASFGSQGQCRTVALALKLAITKLLYAEKKRPPLLLLDDIFGELDRHRRQALLLHIPKGSQAIFTTTELPVEEAPAEASFLTFGKL